MNLLLLVLILTLVSIPAYFLGKQRSLKMVQGNLRDLHSLPSYYGFFTVIWCVMPAVVVAACWLLLEPMVINAIVWSSLSESYQQLAPEQSAKVLQEISKLAYGGELASAKPELAAAAALYQRSFTISHLLLSAISASLVLLFGWLALSKIQPEQRARNSVERLIKLGLMLCASIAILTTIGIIFSVLFESIRFFQKVSWSDFLFGLQWSPQTAIRAGQVGSSGAFGMVPLLVGTLLISLIAMLVAAPVGLLAAIYLSEYASKSVRAVVKPLLELLAGIPTVVYGFFAALTVAPLLHDLGPHLGLTVASESALAAGLVMGIMIIPFVSSLSDDVMNAVPQSLRDGAYGLGATPSETITRVVFPAALPGVVGAMLLAVSRAIGETMIVVMAAGLSANLTFNPLEAVTTVTVQIVTLLTGDQEFESAKTLAAFALGLVLFVVTLILNVIALHVVRTYREQYD